MPGAMGAITAWPGPGAGAVAGDRRARSAPGACATVSAAVGACSSAGAGADAIPGA